MSRSHVYFAKGIKPSFTKYTLCREHELHLVLPQSGGDFLDLDSGRIWNVYIAVIYPGSADDAATYGSLALDWTDPKPGAPRQYTAATPC